MLGPGSGVRVVYDGTGKFQGKDFGFEDTFMGYSCPGISTVLYSQLFVGELIP
jgi:hypothetical protein